jgi:hypothetical protein
MSDNTATAVVPRPPVLWRIVRTRVGGAGRARMRGLEARVDIKRGDKITEFHTSGVFSTKAEANHEDFFCDPGFKEQVCTFDKLGRTKIDGGCLRQQSRQSSKPRTY